MSKLDLSIQSFELSVGQIQKKFESEKGIIYNFLIYTSIFTTVFLFSFLKPMAIYKRFITWLFRIEVTIKGQVWKVYGILLFIVGFFFVFLMCNFYFI
jgi:hypothetical protein